jgi:D-glycero-beta-D-manno-heptose-7-phosphate kinase
MTRSISSVIQPLRLESLATRFKNKRILVVGDLMLDQFIWGDATHISPEAPIPVVKVDSESFMPGGAANVVNNICSVGGQAAIAGIVGKDGPGKVLVKLLQDEGADVACVIVSDQESTIVKTRVIAQRQHVVRIDRESKIKNGKDIRAQLLKSIEESIADFDAVIIEDYGKGMLDQPLVERIIELCRDNEAIVTADPKIDHYLDYSGATLITPNYAEALQLSGIEQNGDIGLDDIVENLHQKWSDCNILMTLGERGMYISRKDAGPVHIGARVRDVYDVAGAGDTVIAISTLALASGASIEEAAAIANLAAGVVVGKIGTATVNIEELIETGADL